MSFISYAQNFEDVMLWRALKHLDRGFYIDVGAWSPDADSVTRAFYERGWCGVNIEPNPEFLQQLSERRSRDINLGFAISDKSGNGRITLLDNPGLSTLDEGIAKIHLQSGYGAKEQYVEVATLRHVCETYVPAGQPIHFLKVDVEGLEAQVLRGNDWQSYRPWVVVVEATVPMSQVASYEGWESILQEANYRFCYADGLNRFYVAEEHAELSAAFRYPPNVFDEFKTYAQNTAETNALEANEQRARANTLKSELEAANARVESLSGELATAQARIEQLGGELADKDDALASAQTALEEQQAHSQWLQNEWNAAKAKVEELNESAHHWWQMADSLNTELQAVYRSRSWRITWPLRKGLAFASWLLRMPIRAIRALVRLPKASARWLLTKLMTFVLRRDRLKWRALQWVNHHPRLKQRLQALARDRGLLPGQHFSYAASQAPFEDSEGAETKQVYATLTPRAHSIYQQLKMAIEKKTQEHR